MLKSKKLVLGVSYTILFFNFYSISIFPLGSVVLQIIFYIQIFLFAILFTANFDFTEFFERKIFGRLDYKYLLFAVLITALLYSTIVHNSGNLDFLSAVKLVSYFILPYIFIACFANLLFNDRKYFEDFLNVIIVFCLVNSIFALFLRVIGFSVSVTYPIQTLGFFSHPNTVSNVYTIAIPILLYKFSAKKINTWLFAGLMIFFLYSLLFTFSRAGYIGAMVGILVFTFIRSKKLFFVSIIIIGIVVAGFVADVAASKSDSSISRILLILTAVEMILSSTGSLLWGYGVYNSIELFKNEKIFFGNFETVVDPHNLILLLGIQFGMFFTIVCLVVFFSITARVIIKRNKFDSNNKLTIALLVSILYAMFFHNMLEDIIVYPEYFVMPLFLTFFGMIIFYYSTISKGVYERFS